MIQNSKVVLPTISMSLTTVIKNILPKSLFYRFIIILIAPVILSQTIIGIIFFEKYTQTILGIISKQMAGDASAITCLLDMNCQPQYIEELKENMNLNVEIINNSKLEKQGTSKNHKAYKALKHAIQNKGYTKYYIDTHDKSMEIYIPSKNKNEIYKISFSRRTLYMKIIPIVIGSGILSSMIFLIIAFIFLKNQIRPIKKLAIEASNFGKGIDNQNYKPEGALEIRSAGMAFCQMKERLTELMNNRLTILAGISHDLRTPLTKMKLQLSLMPKTKETEWLMTDVDMMIKMTESFSLHASKITREISTNENIYSFINSIAKDYTSKDFHIEISGETNITSPIKKISLKRAFANIISNAKKHATMLYIDISIPENHPGMVSISFEDNGRGITLENPKDAFLPFKTENEARTHSDIDSGIGLGLSIARDAINAHRGQIHIAPPKTHGGAHFDILLPIWKLTK